MSKPAAREGFSDYMKKRTLSNKQRITKDVKKLMKDGGFKKFLKKEEQRNKLLEPSSYKIPTHKRKLR
jgi:hypothetical protein